MYIYIYIYMYIDLLVYSYCCFSCVQVQKRNHPDRCFMGPDRGSLPVSVSAICVRAILTYLFWLRVLVTLVVWKLITKATNALLVPVIPGHCFERLGVPGSLFQSNTSV